MSPDDHYFMGDLHLGHANVLKHDNRPFDDIAQHDIALTQNCISVARKNATLWLVGDIAMTREALFSFMANMRTRWGKIILIRGNHDDKVAWRHRDMFDEAHEARYLRVNPEVKVYISHYAHRVWRNSHHGSYHIHGHSHGALPRLGRSADCGAPCVGYAPKPLSWFVEQLAGQPSINHHPAPAKTRVRVVAVSSNTNSFGLKGVILMDQKGRAWQIGVSFSAMTTMDPARIPQEGQEYEVDVSPEGDIQQGSLPFTFEIPKRLEDAPTAVVKEVWK